MYKVGDKIKHKSWTHISFMLIKKVLYNNTYQGDCYVGNAVDIKDIDFTIPEDDITWCKIKRIVNIPKEE